MIRGNMAFPSNLGPVWVASLDAVPFASFEASHLRPQIWTDGQSTYAMYSPKEIAGFNSRPWLRETNRFS